MRATRSLWTALCLAACQTAELPAPTAESGTRGGVLAQVTPATPEREAEPAPEAAQAPSAQGVGGRGRPAPEVGGDQGLPSRDPWLDEEPRRDTHEIDQATMEALEAAIESGDLRVASKIIDGVRSRPYLERARSLLAAGADLEAAQVLDEGLAELLGQPELLQLLGETRLVIGERLEDSSHTELALSAFEQIGATPVGRLGASRAALALGRPEQALELAREGWTLWQALPVIERQSFAGEELPERTLAAALIAAYGNSPEGDTALFAETEEALSQLVAVAPDDPWVWIRLSELYLGASRPFDARDMAARGLDRAPRNSDLAEQLIESARAIDGHASVLAALDDLQTQHPNSPLGYWYSAQERFQYVLARPKPNPREALAEIELRLQRCREVDPTYTRDCLYWEALCHSVAGWYSLRQDNLWGGLKAFEAMEAVMPGGLRTELPGQLESGLVGLTRVAKGFEERGMNPLAADVWNTLRRYEPRELEFAVRAGYTSRRAAEDLEKRSASLAKAARGEIKDPERLERLRDWASVEAGLEGSDEERRRFEITSKSSRNRGMELFEKSYSAYRAASSLAPEDIRIVNDTAEIPIYHLGRDLERAERSLLDCIALAPKQLQDPNLSEDDRIELENAWGDAYQNLGYLCLEYKNDKVAARRWLERSVSVGTDPRPLVTEVLLPRAREAATRRDDQ